MFEAFKIGISIALRDGVTSGLLGVSGHFRTLHGNVGAVNQQLDALERRMKSAKNWAVGGAALAGAGIAGLAAMKSPIEHAIDLDRQVSKLKLFGMGDEVTKQAVAFAHGMNSIGNSYTDNMRRMVEAQGAMRESGIEGPAALAGAKIAMPILGQIAYIAKSLDPENAGKTEASSMAMIRYIEQRGGMNSAEAFKRIANNGFKTITSSGGAVNWEQLRQFSTIAGTAGQYLTEEAINAWYEPIINELKGKSAGEGQRTAYNRVNGIIKLPNQAAHEMVRLGAWDEKQIEWNSQGGIKRFKGNPLMHSDEYAQNSIAWYEKYLMPKYAAQKLTPEAIGRENAMIFGGTGGRMFNLVERQIEMIHNSVKAWTKAANIDQAQKIVDDGPAGKTQALKARWENALTDFGDAALPGFIKGVEWLTETIKSVTAWMQRNPEAASRGILALEAALVGLTLAGGMSIVVAGVKGASSMLGLLGTAATLLTTGPASLATVATGMTGLAASLKGLGVLAALGAGAAIGTAVYAATDETDTMGWLGRGLGKAGTWIGLDSAVEAEGQTNRWQAFRNAQTKPAPKGDIVLKVGQREFARLMNDSVTRAANGTMNGTTQFDVNLAMPPIAVPSTK